ncbi:hypothetical protein EVG20_g8576 [Dentipellis fragilis]|uniref:O-fucosyltransferase family protein n=1 Tax=Dentipellis fragilis TaxID=205917 RepID=A0A4Y9Y4I2_9AGAM|nr:hypothetical protein EVG20_g8576 [Dentipellis fragilis]
MSDHTPFLPTRADSPPYSTKPRRRFLPTFGRPNNVGLFFGTAALSGILFHFLFFSLFVAPASNEWKLALPFSKSLPGLHRPEPTPNVFDHALPYPPPPPPSDHSHLPSPSTVPDARPDELTVEELRDLVAGTSGYFVRDFSLGLGWNNVRYIIEAALIQAKLLNRTLVLPSFVYARACEYNISVCADYAPMVNRGEAIGWSEWSSLPLEQQMGWRIPMSLMLNMTLLRQAHPSILVSDYLRLHGLPLETEFSNGAWQRESYHKNPTVFETNGSKTPSLFVIENKWYDPTGSIRVDSIPDNMKLRGHWSHASMSDETGPTGRWAEQTETPAFKLLMTALPENKFVLDWEAARGALTAGDGDETWDVESDEDLEKVLLDNGWEVLYTFRGALGMDYTKTVVDPVRQVAPRGTIRGLVEEYKDIKDDVLLLAGETHLGRKPGALRFTTTATRADFARIVLFHLHAVDKVFALAEKLDNRMSRLTEGRLWMGAHMRRGDFVRLGWAMENTPEAHITRVVQHLDAGREILQNLTNLTTYDIPNVKPDQAQLYREVPAADDPFYIATDERDPDALDIIASHGAVFFEDLLTIEDRRAFGWALMLTDVRALVEQAILARGAYFYAHSMSSVAGGITNMRAARGADPRTILLD